MQTILRHWPILLPWARSSLTIAQRLHYLQGWAPWLRDGLIVASVPLVAATATYSLAFASSPSAIHPLTSAILAVVSYLAARQAIVYRAWLKLRWSSAAGAGLAILGLVMTVGRAWIRSSMGIHVPFHRTPKERPRTMEHAWASSELVVGAAMAALALGMLVKFGRDGLWTALGLGAYAAVFLSAVCVGALGHRRD